MIRPSEEARKFIGEKEIKGNAGFINPAFEAEMKEEGFLKGYAWCQIFCRLVFMNCYPERQPELRKLFTPGVLSTFRNFKNAGYIQANLPQLDCMVSWEHLKAGKKTGQGHAGIISKVIDQNTFLYISGNTNDSQSREGYIVAEHQWPPAKTDLKLLGFTFIPRPYTMTV